KLVRIQTQVSSETTVDGLVLCEAEAKDKAAESSVTLSPCHRATLSRDEWHEWDVPPDAEAVALPFAPRWLTPQNARLQLGDHNALEVTLADEVRGGIFAVRALPATASGEYVSLRYADADGQEYEVGMVRDLADWPPPER